MRKIVLVFLLLMYHCALIGQTNVADEKLVNYTGAYRVGTNETMTIVHFQLGGNNIFLFTDYATGWRGVLEPVSPDMYRVVERGKAPRQIDPYLTLTKSASSLSIVLKLSDGTLRTGIHIPLRTEEVTYQNGDITLKGTLILPHTTGKKPAIIFVHGSGAATRNDYREWTYYFAANGIAALMFDKRGAGSSGGDWRIANFTELASDVVAGASFLRTRTDIHPDKIGLSGGSQGAWVAPLATLQDNRLAYLIVTGGGPVTPADQEFYRRIRKVQDSGYHENEINEAKLVLALYFEYLRKAGKENIAEVSNVWAKYSAKSWFALLDLPKSDPTIGEWPESRRRSQKELHFDPLPAYKQYNGLTLVVIGEEDQTFPVAKVKEVIAKDLSSKKIDFMLLPKADHGLSIVSDGNKPRHQSPAFFSKTVQWIKQYIK